VFCLGSYRGRLDIIADILRVVSRGSAKKTQIMYGANLSYMVLNKYLREVVDACLISFDYERRCYELTSKGRRFLERYLEYYRWNRRVARRLNDVEAKRKVLEELCTG